MINSTAFDYVNVLTKAADASYQREAILANNISNVDTPGYKRKDLNFEGVLSQELGRCKHQSLDKKISELDTSKLTANVYTDHSNYDEVVCVVLTGMGADGTNGILSLGKSKPIYVIAQDEKSSVVYGMPRAIYEAGVVDEVVTLSDVAKAITKNVGVK